MAKKKTTFTTNRFAGAGKLDKTSGISVGSVGVDSSKTGGKLDITSERITGDIAVDNYIRKAAFRSGTPELLFGVIGRLIDDGASVADIISFVQSFNRTFDEVVLGVDTKVFNLAKVLADGANIVDVPTLAIAKVLSDEGVTIDDAAAFMYNKSASDISVVSDAILLEWIVNLAISDTVEVIDVLDVIANDLEKSVTDGAEVSDSSNWSITKAISDTATIAEAVFLVWLARPVFADVARVSDSDPIFGMGKGLTDGSELSDNTAFTLAKPFFDGSELSDTPVLNPNKVAQDTVEMGDDVITFNFAKVISDLIKTQDNIGIGDGLDYDYYDTTNDLSLIGDDFQRTVDFIRAFDDSAEVGDIYNLLTTKGVTEGIEISDTLAAAITRVRTFLDTVEITDTFTTDLTRGLVPDDVVELTDAISFTINFFINLLDGSSVSDNIALDFTMGEISEGVTIGDVFQGTFLKIQSVTDGIDLSDGIDTFDITKGSDDTVELSEAFSRVWDANIAITDGSEVSDNTSFVFTKPLATEGVDLSDITTFLQGKGLADTVELTDTDPTFIFSKVLGDTVIHSDNLGIGDGLDYDYYDTNLDQSIANDTFTFVWTAGGTYTDSSELSDTLALDLVKVVDDTSEVSDSLAINISTVLLDGSDVSDVPVKVVNKNIDEGVELSDAAPTFDLSKITIDVSDVSDTFDRAWSVNRSFTDASDVSDSPSLNVGKPANDGAVATDTAATEWAAIRSISEGVDLSDSILFAALLDRTLDTDTAELSDSTIFNPTKAPDDTVELTDAAPIFTFTKLLTDGSRLGDNLGIGDGLDYDYYDSTFDQTVANETVALTWAANRTLTDVSDISDSIAFAIGRVQTFTDGIDLSDSTSFAIGYGRTFTDGSNVSDSASFGVGLDLVDSAILSDVFDYVLVANLTPNDGVNTNDTLIRAISKTVGNDGAETSDSTQMTLGKSVSDVSDVTDSGFAFNHNYFDPDYFESGAYYAGQLESF